MKPLSDFLNPHVIKLLRQKINDGFFPGIKFEQAMQFILTDGVMPVTGLSATSFLKLEDWLRLTEEAQTLSYTTTELKNKTGEIIEQVLSGKTVRLTKHGRAVAEIKNLTSTHF